MPTELEMQFHRAMLDIYERAKEFDYRPSDFQKMVARLGGLGAAKALLERNEPSDGFGTLLMLGQLNLSVEAVVLQSKWRTLFTPAELATARKRLEDVKYFDTHPDPSLEAGSTFENEAVDADRVPRAFTHYWTEKSNDEKQGLALQHIASNDFRNRGVRPNDFVFCMTQQGDRLYLIARMHVEQILDAKGAAQALAAPPVYEDRSDHCVCTELRGSPIRFDRELPRDLVAQLRFETQGGEETKIALTADGGVQQQAMRKMRRLTTDSAALLHSIIESDIDPHVVDLDDTYEAEEWRSKLVIHLHRERDRRIVELRKSRAKQETGCLCCEACDFDFTDAYGELGSGFIECHHTTPLSEIGEGQVTRLEDLALVCANCHRILHRAPGMTVDGLRKMVEARRQLRLGVQR